MKKYTLGCSNCSKRSFTIKSSKQTAKKLSNAKKQFAFESVVVEPKKHYRKKNFLIEIIPHI